MAWSESESDGDGDNALEEDLEALRHACTLAGVDPAADDEQDDRQSDTVVFSAEDGSGSDDFDLLRRIQERYSLSPRPLSSKVLPCSASTSECCDDEEEDDFETLRAIQRRFSLYEKDNTAGTSKRNIEQTNMMDDGKSGHEMFNSFYENENSRALSAELNTLSTKNHSEEDAISSGHFRPVLVSHFPKSVQNFVDAIKRNRSCQKIIRRKLIEIESKIEENKHLKERVKCLMEFQLACIKRVAQAFTQKKDPRVRLISMQSSAITNRKTGSKMPRTGVSYLGPVENSHVANYRMVVERFPLSLRKASWSNIEKEKLARGIKQQYQEMLVLNLLNDDSGEAGSVEPNMTLALQENDFEVTPERMRSFLPLVDWDRLASMYLHGRSGPECESRWLNCDDPLINHNAWTAAEDKKLLYIVQERGLYNWIDIAVMLGTSRTPFQCLARYQRSLNPHILNKDWTPDEDAKLCAAVELFGDNNWQMVASTMEGRTGIQCSNRWRKSLNPDRSKVGRWSVEEDKRLKAAVMLFGAKNWNKIARFAHGRTQEQCRERWLNCLDPSLKLDAWTAEEDAKLLEAIEEHNHSWSKIAASVPGRTDNQCRRRWKALCPDEVPLLQAARKMKRTLLISNFVGREGERPAIGPNDFSPLPIASSGDTSGNKKKRSRAGRSNLGSKSRKSMNPEEDDMHKFSTDDMPGDLVLIDPTTPDNFVEARVKRKRKRPLCAVQNGKKKRTRKTKLSNEVRSSDTIPMSNSTETLISVGNQNPGHEVAHVGVVAPIDSQYSLRSGCTKTTNKKSLSAAWSRGRKQKGKYQFRQCCSDQLPDSGALQGPSPSGNSMTSGAATLDAEASGVCPLLPLVDKANSVESEPSKSSKEQSLRDDYLLGDFYVWLDSSKVKV